MKIELELPGEVIDQLRTFAPLHLLKRDGWWLNSEERVQHAGLGSVISIYLVDAVVDLFKDLPA